MKHHADQAHTFLVSRRGLLTVEGSESPVTPSQHPFRMAEIVPFSAKLLNNWPRFPLKQRVHLAVSVANLALNTMGTLWNPNPAGPTRLGFLQANGRMRLTPLLISNEPHEVAELLDLSTQLIALGILLLEIFTLQPLIETPTVGFDLTLADHSSRLAHVKNLALIGSSETPWDVSDLFREAVTACLTAGNLSLDAPPGKTQASFVEFMLDRVLLPLETEMKCCWEQSDLSCIPPELFVDDMPLWNAFERDEDVIDLQETQKPHHPHDAGEHTESSQGTAVCGETFLKR